MRAAVLFPGQGEEVEPILEAWFESSAAVRALVEEAAARLEMGASDLLARRCRQLRRTAILQPLSTALSLGVWEELRGLGVRASVVAGHSLGEVPAAGAAGLLDPGGAVEVAAVRGRVMGREAGRRPGGMAALPTSDPDLVDEALRRGSAGGELVIAAHNGPSQTVISGDEAGLRLLGAGATRLAVEGAWHSPAMAGAVDEYRSCLDRHLRGAPDVPMLANATGRRVADAADAARRLAEQLVRPVRWVTLMASLLAMDVRTVLTVGPARSLRGLVRDCAGSALTVVRVDGPEDLDRLSEELEA